MFESVRTSISIIIPVYNAAAYLQSCIESILFQSFSEFEILLIDDGSKDESGSICDQYAEMDSRIRVFHKENGGVSSARNLGLSHANGEWVCFVDADDELMPDGLQVLASGISVKVDLVIAGYSMYDGNGSLIYSINLNQDSILTREQAVKEMYEPTHYWYQGFICSKLFRVSTIEQQGLRFAKDIYFNEDRLFLTQFILSSSRDVFYTTKSVYKYYKRQDSAMTSLTRSFNPRFVTDMVAAARMKRLVWERCDDEVLRDLANYEVYKSYRRIVGMMREFEYVNRSLKSDLLFKLLDTIGINAFVGYEWNRDKRRLMNKIRKIVLCKNF